MGAGERQVNLKANVLDKPHTRRASFQARVCWRISTAMLSSTYMSFTAAGYQELYYADEGV